MQYTIHWKSRITGKAGNGEKSFEHDVAQDICDKLNAEDKHILFHWIEAVSEQGAAPDENPPV